MYQTCRHISLLSEVDDSHETRSGRSRGWHSSAAVLKAVSELRELIPAILCSAVTTSYALRAEQMNSTPGREATLSIQDSSTPLSPPPPPSHLDGGQHEPILGGYLSNGIDIGRLLATGPPAALALAACLALGCSLSWHAHRRREQDLYQGPIFGAWGVWACLVARAAGLRRDVLVLALLPWTLCAAVLSSYLGHALLVRAGEGAGGRDGNRDESTIARCEIETVVLLGGRAPEGAHGVDCQFYSKNDMGEDSIGEGEEIANEKETFMG